MIRIKRAYESAEPTDGKRVLVDRLWPRGVSRDDLDIEMWLKDVAPSSELRQWFGHDPARWKSFRERYRRELEGNEAAISTLVDLARSGDVTLVYGARDEEHNDAVVLKTYLDGKIG